MDVFKFLKSLFTHDHIDISELEGKVLKNVEKSRYDDSEDQIIFTTEDGKMFRLYHDQSCCEEVRIESIVGELEWLVGNPITMAEVVTQEGKKGWDGTSTWSFYKFATIRGYVTIRWYGESNGYYSEEVDFCRLEPKP